MTRPAASSTVSNPRPSTGEVEREQGDPHRGADHLEHENGAGHAVVEPCDSDTLRVDHLVQALDVQARGGVHR